MNASDANASNPLPRLDDGVCPELRTKTMYLNVEVRRSPEAEGRGTAVYWCLKTHGALGPDDLPADPPACRRPRACCTSPLIEV